MEPISPGKVSGSQVLLPAEFRQEADIEDGSEVVFRRTKHGIVIRTLAEVVCQAQNRFARLSKPGESVVAELIHDRREAADHE